MKYRPRLKIYKSSTGKNTFNPQTNQAHSYDWWLYVTPFKMKHGGEILLFNNHNYSMTTNGHQSETSSLLEYELKLPTFHFDFGRDSLPEDQEELKELLDKALRSLYTELFENEIAVINGTSKTVKSKKHTSQHLLKKIDFIETFLIEPLSFEAQKELKEKAETRYLRDLIEREFQRDEGRPQGPHPLTKEIKDQFNSLEPLNFLDNEFNELGPID